MKFVNFKGRIRQKEIIFLPNYDNDLEYKKNTLKKLLKELFSISFKAI